MADWHFFYGFSVVYVKFIDKICKIIQNIENSNRILLNERGKREMRCPKCGYELIPNSRFCQQCGYLVDSVESPTVAFEGMVTEPVMPNYVQEEAPNAAKKKKPIGLLIAVILLGVLLVASAGVNVLQFLQSKETKETVATQEDEIENLNKEISSQKATIADQEASISALEESSALLEVKADYYDEICNQLDSGTIGYAASNFNVNESIILVSQDEYDRQFTLTANWSSGGTVYVEYSSDAATVSFDNNEWSTSTTMTVVPQHEGVTAVTFSNSVDYRTFKLLIVVTE